jgi:hypothetical protein
MAHTPHSVRRAAFWLVIASVALTGLALLLIGRDHKITGALALGFLAILIMKHIGLFLLVGSPLVGLANAARMRLWRKEHR